MLMHADQAGDHGVAGQILITGGGRHGDLVEIAHRFDQAVADDDGLISSRGRAGAVDDADMRQGNKFTIYANERLRGSQTRERCHRDDEAHEAIEPQRETLLEFRREDCKIEPPVRRESRVRYCIQPSAHSFGLRE